MQERRFRQAFLTEVEEGRGIRSTIRLVSVGITAVVVGFIALLLYRASNPNIRDYQDLAVPFYLFHDNVFLQIKGHWYTRYLPGSRIYWSLGAIILITILLSWLLDRSFILEPHIRLLRAAVRRPTMHRWLILPARFSAELFLDGHHLLRHVVEEERQYALVTLMALPQGEARDGQFRRLITLSYLILELDLIGSSRTRINESRLYAATQWINAANLLLYHKTSDSIERFCAMADTIVNKLEIENLSDSQDIFSEQRIVAEVLIDNAHVLRQLSSTDMENGLFDVVSSVPLRQVQTSLEILNRREDQLTTLCTTINSIAWQDENLRRMSYGSTQQQVYPTSFTHSFGDLLVGQALFLSQLTQEPSVVVSLISILEELRLSSNVLSDNAIDGNDYTQTMGDQTIEQLSDMVEAFSSYHPNIVTRLLVARLNQQAYQDRQSEFSVEGYSGEDFFKELISPDDDTSLFELRSLADRLYAGPHN